MAITRTSSQRVGLVDTDPKADAVQIECYRAMTVARRMEIARALTAAAFAQSFRSIADANPDSSDREKKIMMIELNYGTELAQQVRHRLSE